ncbi:hypothetical protein HDV00_001392 [Rhizophlyctis rosea]|nr:hypothetical protein HDV00_001392 [Rhizophlyctis rosea]
MCVRKVASFASNIPQSLNLHPLLNETHTSPAAIEKPLPVCSQDQGEGRTFVALQDEPEAGKRRLTQQKDASKSTSNSQNSQAPPDETTVVVRLQEEVDKIWSELGKQAARMRGEENQRWLELPHGDHPQLEQPPSIKIKAPSTPPRPSTPPPPTTASNSLSLDHAKDILVYAENDLETKVLINSSMDVILAGAREVERWRGVISEMEKRGSFSDLVKKDELKGVVETAAHGFMEGESRSLQLRHTEGELAFLVGWILFILLNLWRGVRWL